MAECGEALPSGRLVKGSIPYEGKVFASSKQRYRDAELLLLLLLSLLFSLGDLLSGCQEMNETTDPSSAPHFFPFEFLHLKGRFTSHYKLQEFLYPMLGHSFAKATSLKQNSLFM